MNAVSQETLPFKRQVPPQFRRFAGVRPRRKPGVMNKLESDYATHLAILKGNGLVLDFRYEALKLKLAKNTWYNPDFIVITETAFEIHEVKGFWEDHARVKIKVAAELFPWIAFKAVTGRKGRWEFEEIGS